MVEGVQQGPVLVGTFFTVLVAAVVVVVACAVCVWVRVWCVGAVFGCLPPPLRAPV